MTIKTLGMGAVKFLKATKKSWQDKRIEAMNRKIKESKRGPAMTEHFIDEHAAVSASKAPSKKVYKSIQRKWHALKPDQQSKVYLKKAKRPP